MEILARKKSHRHDSVLASCIKHGKLRVWIVERNLTPDGLLSWAETFFLVGVSASAEEAVELFPRHKDLLSAVASPVEDNRQSCKTHSVAKKYKIA